jgi:16S rRNA (cytosine967-C5)-methyltransferase
MILNYIAECVIASLDGKEEVKVLDMCSAPGSKALYVALIDPDRIHVTMRDISEYKTDMIRDNADRLSVDNVDIEVNDACKKNPSDVDSKDIVILDAPCSGLGVIRRKKDIKYNMSFEQTKELVDIQKQMLDNAADYVSLGGYLIYSTCTTNKNENSVQIQHFLDGHTNYELLYERQMLIKGEDNSLSDGFYVAVMKRR